jgi:hypothetical protein
MTVLIAGLEIGGAGDLARRWGVSSQRVRQLAAVEGFPAALGDINGHPAYNVAACDHWREQHRRRSGRPRMSRAEVDAIAGGRA